VVDLPGIFCQKMNLSDVQNVRPLPWANREQSKAIAIDLSTIDTLSVGSGQYRYAISLVTALANLNFSNRLIVIGSFPHPIAPLVKTLCSRPDRIVYQSLAPQAGYGGFWIDQLRRFAFLRRHQAGIVHNLHGNLPIISPCPTVVTHFDLAYEQFDEYKTVRESRVFRINRWAIKKKASRIIAISAMSARELRERWKIDSSRIDIVPLGNTLEELRDLQRISFRTETPEPVLRILSPYNLEPRKNLSSLIRAIGLLKSRYPALRLTLYGNAAVTKEREQNFVRLVNDLGLDKLICFTGIIDDSELAHLYWSNEIFVFPSLYEGFGLPVLEAMAAGKPVIARNASAMAEIVGNAGILVETRNPPEIAEAISRLIDNPPLRKNLGRLASARAKEFTVERMAELTYASYRRALIA
jgi:glycosyltransferase involved in cell wall biosynthesis